MNDIIGPVQLYATHTSLRYITYATNHASWRHPANNPKTR